MKTPDEETLTRIGTDPRWLFGGLKLDKNRPQRSLLEEMLIQYLGIDAAEQLAPRAATIASTSRQIAIRQHISEGIPKAYADRTTDWTEIRDKVQKLMCVSRSQANRVMNGLGIFYADDPGTARLVEHFVGGRGEFVRELDVDLIQLLAAGAGENIDLLIQKPYVFFANSAAAALRISVFCDDDDDVAEKVEVIRNNFPPIPFAPPRQTNDSCSELTPLSQIGVYGLTMWQGTGKYLGSKVDAAEEPNLCFGHNLGNIIRIAASVSPWIFPELIQLGFDPNLMGQLPDSDKILQAQRSQQARLVNAQCDSKYLDLMSTAIKNVGLEIGKVICGIAPYTDAPGGPKDAAG